MLHSMDSMDYPAPLFAGFSSYSSSSKADSTAATRSSRPESAPSQIVSRPHPLALTYNCTLCWRTFPPPCFTVGVGSRIVCVDCWRWIYDVSVCWRCGEIVHRKTDSVRFGWCWWHWSCFSCLICAVRLPNYFSPLSADIQRRPCILQPTSTSMGSRTSQACPPIICRSASYVVILRRPQKSSSNTSVSSRRQSMLMNLLWRTPLPSPPVYLYSPLLNQTKQNQLANLSSRVKVVHPYQHG